MKKALANIAKLSIGFGIAGFLIWWSLHNLSKEDFNDIKSVLLHARYWLIIVVFAILLFSHWLRTLRWKQMILPMGYHPSLFDLLCGLLVGYFANQLVPRAGEIIRCTAVAGKDKIPAEKLFGTIVVERIFDILCLLILSITTFFLEYSHIKLYADEIFTAINNKLLNNNFLLILSFLLLVAVITAIIFFIKKRAKNKNQSLFIKIFMGLKEGLLSIRKVKNKFLFIIYTIAIWLCYVLSTWLGCFALQETEHLSFAAGIAMLVFGTFGIIVSPGGLGAYPIAIQKTLMFYGIASNIGLAAGWLLWTAQFIFTLLFGTLAYMFLTFTKKKKNEEHRLHSA